MGFYWETKERHLATRECTTEEEFLDFMHTLFPGDAKYVTGYTYLIQPITLGARMKQLYVPVEGEAKMQLFLTVQDFSIKLDKSQLDNMMRLLESANEYKNFEGFQSVVYH